GGGGDGVEGCSREGEIGGIEIGADQAACGAEPAGNRAGGTAETDGAVHRHASRTKIKDVEHLLKQDRNVPNLAAHGESLREDVFHRVAMDVGEADVSALEFEGQAFVVDAQAVEQRGVEVMDVDGVFGDVVAVVIGLTVGDAGFDAAAGEEEREASAVV